MSYLDPNPWILILQLLGTEPVKSEVIYKADPHTCLEEALQISEIIDGSKTQEKAMIINGWSRSDFDEHIQILFESIAEELATAQCKQVEQDYDFRPVVTSPGFGNQIAKNLR